MASFLFIFYFHHQDYLDFIVENDCQVNAKMAFFFLVSKINKNKIKRG
jgi:hypothetical protein